MPWNIPVFDSTGKIKDARVGASGDWSSRSSEAGVIYSQRFDTAATVTTEGSSTTAGWIDDDDGGAYGGHYFWDEGPENGDLIPVSSDGGNGVLRLDTYYYDTSGHGNWITPPWSTVFDSAGQEFWVQFRVWHTFNRCMYAHRGSGSSNNAPHGEGLKTCIISNWPSNQVYEIVLQKLDNYGLVRGYHQRDGGDIVRGWEQSYSSFLNALDLRITAIDTGTPSSPSNIAEELRRYGGLHYYQRDPGGQIDVEGIPYIPGRPDPYTPGFRFYPNEWVTMMCHVEIITSSQTRHTWYAARERDSSFTQISPVVTENSMTPDYDRLWLLPYETQGAAESGGDSWGPWSGGPITAPRRQTSGVGYQSVIVSTNTIAVPTARSNYTIEDEILSLSTGAFSSTNPFTMGNYDNTFMNAGGTPTARTIIQYGGKGFYDPFRRELIFRGGGHSDATSNAVARYDMANNSWSRTSGIAEPFYLHGYERSAFDNTTGRFFSCNEGSSSQGFHEWNYGTNSWDALTTMTNFEFGFNQIAPAMEYFPELQGIVHYHSGRGCGLFNLDTETWYDLGQSGANFNTTNTYHSICRYNPVLAEMLILSGYSGPGTTTMWILDRYGNFTTARNLPSFTIGPGEPGGLLFVCEDPDSQYYGQYIAMQMGASGSLDVEVYDSKANSWASLGTHGVYSPDTNAYHAIPVPTVHGVLILHGDNSNANFTLYRMPL